MTAETYTARQQRAANAQRARLLLDEWHDAAKPALDRIERAALAFLDALEEARGDLCLAPITAHTRNCVARLLRADDVKAVDGLACDTAGRTIDLLVELAATQRRELDEHGGNPDDMTLDLSVLEAAHRAWSRRWNARRPA